MQEPKTPAKPPTVFFGRKVNGQFLVDKRERFRMLKDSFAEGEEFEITLRKKRSKSDRQKKFFHGPLLGAIAEHTGYETKDEIESLKTFLKERFLTVNEGDNHYVRRTSSLNVAEYNRFIEQCIQWAAEYHGIVIEDAGAHGHDIGEKPKGR